MILNHAQWVWAKETFIGRDFLVLLQEGLRSLQCPTPALGSPCHVCPHRTSKATPLLLSAGSRAAKHWMGRGLPPQARSERDTKEDHAKMRIQTQPKDVFRVEHPWGNHWKPPQPRGGTLEEILYSYSLRKRPLKGDGTVDSQ